MPYDTDAAPCRAIRDAAADEALIRFAIDIDALRCRLVPCLLLFYLLFIDALMRRAFRYATLLIAPPCHADVFATPLTLLLSLPIRHAAA